MSKGLHDAEDELAPDELDVCSGTAFADKQVDSFQAFYFLFTLLALHNHQKPLHYIIVDI